MWLHERAQDAPAHAANLVANNVNALYGVLVIVQPYVVEPVWWLLTTVAYYGPGILHQPWWRSPVIVKAKSRYRTVADPPNRLLSTELSSDGNISKWGTLLLGHDYCVYFILDSS